MTTTDRRAARGPGPVLPAHRLLIASAFVAAVVYLLWELREYARGGGSSALLAALLALVACVVLGAYFRTLRTLRARLTPRDDASRGSGRR